MDELTVWLADIRPLAAEEERVLAMLTPKRRAAALRFKQQEDRLHCAAAGLLLRRVLGVARDEDIVLGEQGKPMLAAGGVHFNLTHGGDFAALAVFSAPVGVDVEPVRRERKLRIPRRYLLPEEQAWLERDNTPERFGWLWTRLEAVLKADGRGLTLTGRTDPILSDDGPMHIKTVSHKGHYLSAAAPAPFELKTVTLSPAELLGEG